MPRTLIIVGRPRPDRENMTSLLVKTLTEQNVPFIRVDGAPFPDNIPSDSIVAYFSSGLRFPSILDECRKRELTLIVATSGLEAGRDVPLDIDIPVIMAPNLSLLIMILFKTFDLMGSLVQNIGAKAYVAEGHQKLKTSAPATAQKIAGYFGNPPESVGSIRDDAVAAAVLGILEENLGGFGAHFFAVSHQGATYRGSFSTKGRLMYIPGLLAVADAIEGTEGGLKPGIYEGHELVFPPNPLQRQVEQLIAEKGFLMSQIKTLQGELVAARM